MRRSTIAVASLLFVILLPLACLAKQNWVEVRSPNFIVVSNAGEKSARKAALQFEQIRLVFRQSLKGASEHPSPIVTVLAVKDEASMRELLPEYWEKGRAHPAGLFVGRLNQLFAAVMLDAHGANPYETFYHEYYHAISLPYFANLPLWLAEGLAEFYGHTEIDDKFVGMGEAFPILFEQLRYGAFIPLNVLFEVDRSSPYYNETNKSSAFYVESWALTHYLLFGDRMAHRDMLDAYLEALARGKSQPDSAALAFSDLKKLQTDLQAYIRRDSFLYSKTPAPGKIQEEEFKARPLTEAEAVAYRGGFAAIRGRDDAAGILQQAIQLDPNVAMAYQFLGMTQFFANQTQGAVQSLSKAITLDPRNSFTRYLRAFLTTDGTGIASDKPQVEEDLRTAIAISPDFAPPYSLLALYLAANDKSPSEALSLAQRAVAFEPGNSTFQLALAQVLARINKLDEAGIVAARAVKLAKDDGERANADSFTDYLQRMRQYQNGMAARDSEEQLTTEQKPRSVPDPAANRALTSQATPATSLQMQASISILSDTSGIDLTDYLKAIMEGMRKSLASNITKVSVETPRNLAVEFVVLRDGRIVGSTIAASSGDVALDQAVGNSVTGAGPLPGLPARFKGQSLRLHLGVSCGPESFNPKLNERRKTGPSARLASSPSPAS